MVLAALSINLFEKYFKKCLTDKRGRDNMSKQSRNA